MKKRLRHILNIFVLTFAMGILSASAQTTLCSDLQCKITQIVIGADSTISYSGEKLKHRPDIQMSYEHNNIKFVFLGETKDDNCRNQIEYSTFLENYSDQWTPWSNLREAEYVNLRDGNYVFKVRAKFSDEVISEIASYFFSVDAPPYRSTLAYVLYTIGFISLIIGIIYIYKRSFNKERESLLAALKERTQGLIDTNNELKLQKESLDKTIKDLSMLSSSGQNIIKNLTIKEISLCCYRELNNFFKTDNLSIGIFNAIHNSLDFSAFILDDELMPFARYNLENTDNMHVWSFLNGKSAVLDDYKNQVLDYIDPVYKPDTDLCGSAVFIPLFDSDMAVGVMSIMSSRTFFFNNYHISIIHNFATYVETAIANFYIFRKLNTQKRLLEDRSTQLEETYNTLKISQETIAKVNSELSKLSVAVKNIDNAVSMFDADGYLEWINLGYTKVYGYTTEEVSHRTLTIETVFKDPQVIENYRKVYSKAKSMSFSHSHINADGKILWLQTTLTPILNDDGKTVKQIVAVESDISDQKKAESEIRKQRNEIDIKNKDLTKSIEYASTIQKALMPDQTDLEQFFQHSFMLNLPKDIVSGDFFWITRKFGRKYFALCDCAGHGVPGAFVSLMGKMFLDEILHSVKLEDTPAVIIRKLNDKMHESVSNLSDKVGGIDGMDLCFCIVNSRNTMLQYAGAYRPLYMVRNGELTKYLPDRCSLGNIPLDSDYKFTNHDIALKNNDLLILTSDGYADQFGHVNGKKLGRNNFADLLVEASQFETEQMADFFLTKHREWKGNLEQIDDILLTGIKISFDDSEKMFDDDEEE